MNAIQELWIIILYALNLQTRERCVLNSRTHFNQFVPIIIRDGKLLEPNDGEGNVIMLFGDKLTLSCEGSGPIHHPNTLRDEVTATVYCGGGANFQNDEWLSAPSLFNFFQCHEAPKYSSRRAHRNCVNNHSVFEVGYSVQDTFYPLYESCFNEMDLKAIYSKYTQKPYNSMHQTEVDQPVVMSSHNAYGQVNYNELDEKHDSTYYNSIRQTKPDGPLLLSSHDVYRQVPFNSLYNPRRKKEAVIQLVGNVIVDQYITKDQYLSRGHLASKSDFIFPFGERASYHHVNCAPRWSGLNSGNWQKLEVDLRNYIHRAGLDTIIYTGTYGVSQLYNEYGRKVDIHLCTDEHDNPVIPVPLYFYKVVYEPKRMRGIAFIGINGPYYTPSELKDLYFCKNICSNKRDWPWLTWNPENAKAGYTFCCSVPDFRDTVGDLPGFKVDGLFK